MRKLRGKAVLALITVMLLLVVALGPAAPSSGGALHSQVDTAEMWETLDGLLANPSGGAGSNAT